MPELSHLLNIKYDKQLGIVNPTDRNSLFDQPAGQYSQDGLTSPSLNVTGYLRKVLLDFGSFVTGCTGAIVTRGPEAVDEAAEVARELANSL